MSTTGNGSECPECGSTDTPSRLGGWDIDGQRIRQRLCRDCRFRFVTVEVPVFVEDDRVIPYSWLDEEYRRKQREISRRKHGSYRGLKTKPTIEGVARLFVKVKVSLERGMRPQAEHGTARPVFSQQPKGINSRTLVPPRDRKAIARRYRAGESTDRLAREYRISPRTINRYAARYGREESA